MKISDLKIHHFGVAVSSIEKAAAAYAENGFLLGEKIFDPRQDVYICFAEKPDEIAVELIEPASENSPVAKIVKKSAGEPEVYHICYAVADIDATISALRRESWLLVKPPVPACVWGGGTRVAFLYSKTAGLIELLEMQHPSAS